jgi:excinuclease ABC subunit C
VRRPAPGDFGPYLGGQKARAAVSGLGRMLPLAHAADGQAGAERDLARLRGASPAARAELARGIAAVLGRDRGAVAALRGADRPPRRGRARLRVRREIAG